MDIKLGDQNFGRLYIKMLRDAFPAGVENFINIALGKTCRVIDKGSGKYKFRKEIRRTFNGCKFYQMHHNNYIISGDIYQNDGTHAGTIFNDKPIPNEPGEYYYPHETKGLLTLVPFSDEDDGNIYYDSTFMITLDDVRTNNVLRELDEDHIVIGHVCGGMDILDKINQMIKPFAGRKYPRFEIDKCGIHRNHIPRIKYPSSYDN